MVMRLRYLVILDFNDAPFLVCLSSENGDVNRAWRLVVIDPTVHDFLCLLLRSSTRSANN